MSLDIFQTFQLLIGMNFYIGLIVVRNRPNHHLLCSSLHLCKVFRLYRVTFSILFSFISSIQEKRTQTNPE